MSTQLALPENKKVIPKPTKDEIITAMVEISREQYLARKAEHAGLLGKAQKKAEDYAISRIKKEFRTANIEPVLYTRGHNCGRISLSLDFAPDEKSTALQSELERLESVVRETFDEKETWRFIKEELMGLTPKAERVQLILTDKASRKHLEEVLHKIENPEEQAA